MVQNELIYAIKKERYPVILPHVNADGDALGASIALALALEKLGKRPVVYLEEDFPVLYEFLAAGSQVQKFEEKINSPSLAIAVDTGDRKRLGRRIELFDSANITINIDHHTTNTFYAQFNDVRSSSSSAGEIMVDIIEALSIEIDRSIAECIYVAIATDTGGFRYSNTSAETHRIAARLLEKGIDVANLSRHIFETVSFEKVKLMGKAISSIELLCNGKVCTMCLTDEALKETGACEEDYDGLVNLGRNIRGVETALLFRHSSRGIKVNLRSNEYVDVAEIASNFGGGGHQRASGFTIEGSLKDIMKKTIKQVMLKIRTGS